MDVAVGASAIKPAALFTLHVATTLNTHVTRFKWMPFSILWWSSPAATATAPAGCCFMNFGVLGFCLPMLLQNGIMVLRFEMGTNVCHLISLQFSWANTSEGHVPTCHVMPSELCVCEMREKRFHLLLFHSIPFRSPKHVHTHKPAITSPSKLIAVTRSKIPIALTERSHEQQTPWASGFGHWVPMTTMTAIMCYFKVENVYHFHSYHYASSP